MKLDLNQFLNWILGIFLFTIIIALNLNGQLAQFKRLSGQ